ncbi:MAG: hypothetical protein U1F35_15270 [Steroidobacteraceae bacterium]|nr:hypothetical protein [Pseudomonadota bacterium]
MLNRRLDALLELLRHHRLYNQFSISLMTASAVIILSHLRLPLTGDQALYLYGAKAMDAGEVLYKDFWDVKQPGVYIFYWLAGRLFGFDALGLHIMEAIWLAAAAYLATDMAARSIRSPLIRRVLPLTSVGCFYVAASAWHLTQPDGLVALPIVLGAWAICGHFDPGPISSGRLFIVGVSAGLAGLFVTTMLVVPLGLLLTAVWSRWHRSQRRTCWPGLAGYFAVAAGFLAVVGVMLAWFAAKGALAEMLWTNFSHPFASYVERDREVSQMAGSVKWFVEATLCWQPLALLGCLVTLRREMHGDAGALPGLLAMSWIGLAACGILLQYRYFWAFHFNQMFVPFGILAALGIEAVLRQLRVTPRLGAKRLAYIAILAAALAFPCLVTLKVYRLVSAVPQADQYAQSAAGAVGHANPNDRIFVFGNPRILLASGLRQAVPENGWALELLTADQWLTFGERIKRARPAFVYLDTGYDNLLTAEQPAIKRWLIAEYRVVARDTLGGTWFAATYE